MGKKRTNPILVVILCALSLVLVTILILLFMGYRYVSDSGYKFIGKVKDGQPYQSTFMKDPNGNSLTLRKEGKQFTLTSENGDIYVGEMDGLLRDGKGKFTCNKRNTDGRDIYDVYEGDWKDDKPHGKGTYTYDVYVNDKTGQSTHGDVYTGDIANGAWEGNGTYKWANGDSYEGSFIAGLADGEGTYIWANGNLYSGGFAKGARNGYGTFTMASGEIYTGNWVDDRRDTLGADGELQYVNGDRYVGAFIANLPDTRKRDENGNFVLDENGDFVHGAKALYTYANGNFYAGYFEAGKIAVTENSAPEITPTVPDESSKAE